MAVIFPKIECAKARIVVNKMRRLLARRHCHEISRMQFLSAYAELRESLNATPEYVKLRRLVFVRSKGTCEKCRVAPAEHMAHRTAVAFRPDLALDPKNVYAACIPCHQLDHPNLELVR